MPKRLLNKSELAPKRGFRKILKNKTFRLPALTLVMMLLAAGISLSDADVVAYAAQGDYTVSTQSVQTQTSQSPRWHEQNGTWYLKNEQGTGNQTGWFQDLDQSWYMLDSTDGHMYAGLVHDTSTDKWYYCETEHQGHYGRMAVTDGVYSVNGQSVYIAFNKSHDGTYGAITSGLSELQRVGVPTTNVNGLPTESTTSTPPANANQQTPPQNDNQSDIDKARASFGNGFGDKDPADRTTGSLNTN